MHDRVIAVLDHTGHPDTDPEHGFRRDTRLTDDSIEAL